MGDDGRGGGQRAHRAVVRARAAVALAKAYNGASVGGVIFSPLWVALIAFGASPAPPSPWA